MGPSNNNFQAMRAKGAISETYVQIDKSYNDEDKVDTMTLLTDEKGQPCSASTS
jgi:hypothetical protein